MAVVELIDSIKGNVLLNIGTTSSGGIRTKAISVGKINEATYDAEKYFAIARALANIFDYTVYETQSVKTYMVTNQ